MNIMEIGKRREGTEKQQGKLSWLLDLKEKQALETRWS